MVGGRNQVEGEVTLIIKIGRVEKMVNIFVVNDNNFRYDALLGLDLITSFYLRQDYNLKIYQRSASDLTANKPTPRDFDSNKAADESAQHENEIINCNPSFQEHKQEILVNYNEGINTDAFEAKLEHLPSNKSNKIKSIIKKYKNIFAQDKYDVGSFRSHEAHIKLLEHKFISRKPYRCSPTDQKEIESQITNLLKNGLIEESCSPFAAPITLAYKKDGEKEKKKIGYASIFPN